MTSLTISHCKGKFSNCKTLNTLKKTKVVLLSEKLIMLKASQGVCKKKKKKSFQDFNF